MLIKRSMRFRLTIGKKLSLGFGLLLLAILFNGVLTFKTLTESRKYNEQITEVYTPSISYLKDLNLLINLSKTLMATWLLEDAEEDESVDKQLLRTLHEYEYPDLKKNIKNLTRKWNYTDQLMMDSIFIQMDSLIEIEHDLMLRYRTESYYYTPSSAPEERAALIKVFNSTDPKSDIPKILNRLERVIQNQEIYAHDYSAKMDDSFDSFQIYLLYLVCILLIGTLIAFFTISSIIHPINRLKDNLLTMGRGIFPIKKISASDDELGEMSTALNNLVEGLKRTSDFAKEIGEGNFNSLFKPLSVDDILGNSLLMMRENLALVTDDDQKRNWASEGLTIFGELLRKHSHNLTGLSENLISELVKYLEANQGGIFVINDELSNPLLELKACYAWDRQKYLEQKVIKGDGLVGQSWQEKNTLYITDVPNDYINITSGLGEATPKCILIVPMIMNDDVFGVIELASFYRYENYKVQFVERLAQMIASTISTVKVNERTKKLLEQAQLASEQMRAQEEELRQNQEEMKLSQLEMQKNIETYIKQINEFKAKEKQYRDEIQAQQMLILKHSKDIDRLKQDLEKEY